MAFSGLAHGGKNVTYRTAECRNRLIVGDLWALWGTEGHVAFLLQSCYPQTWGRESSQKQPSLGTFPETRAAVKIIWVSGLAEQSGRAGAVTFQSLLQQKSLYRGKKKKFC